MRFSARCALLLTQGQIRWSTPLSPPELNSFHLQAACRTIARSLMAGEANADAVEARLAAAMGWADTAKTRRRLRPLARRYAAWVQGRLRPRLAEIAAFLRQDRGLQALLRAHPEQWKSKTLLTEPAVMQPAAVAAGWGVPAICSVGELAAWLHLNAGELEWFADLKGLTARRWSSTELGHYHYRVLAKASGGVRLIEAPKERLKEIQRQIRMRILDAVPAHEAAHGFVRGRSIKTFVAPHVGRRVVLRMDLREFFPSFAGARIQALFRLMGYPEPVADRLGGLCMTVTPAVVWKWPGPGAGATGGIEPGVLGEARALYARPHLPQGAPTSPALANVCAYRMDCRLSGLARSAGAEYTRYADDLAFSGDDDFARNTERFALEVAAILHDEGFAVHHRKTRIMRQGVRQHLAGLVTNERVNVVRSDFDRLKATLTNCVRLGPESQNREALLFFRLHLAGRVGFVEQIHPAKGARLRKIFEQIRW